MFRVPRSVFVVFCLLLTSTLAAAPLSTIENLTATAANGKVSVRFSLAGAFANGEMVEALQSGLPTSFTYIVEIFRDRPNWFDDGIARARIEVICTFNSVTREYLLNYRRDDRLVRSETFSDPSALERSMTTVEEMDLFDIGRRKPYKLKVRAKADLMRGWLMYVIPWEVSTRWRETRVALKQSALNQSAVGSRRSAAATADRRPPTADSSQAADSGQPMNPRDLLLRYRKDPRFIVSVPLVILAATSLVYYVTQQAKELTPEALSNRLLLFVLWNINLLLIIGILFVLLRGVVKMVLERQRGIIGSRFRTKLVVTYVATSLLPVVILFIVATDLLRVSIDRWFATPVWKILQNSEAIAQGAQDQAADLAGGAAREIAAHPEARDPGRVDAVLAHVRDFHQIDIAAVYHDGVLVKAQASPRAPIDEIAEPSPRFFEEVMSKGRAVKIDVAPSGKWIRTAVALPGSGDAALAGVFIPAAMSRRIDESIIAHRDFQQLRSQRTTLKASQTMLFLAVTLAILFGTLWTSIYASRRITVPLKALAEATATLAEGNVGHRVDVTATDEVGKLIDSFNEMSSQLARQRQQLTETNRFTMTVLESVATGIIAFNDSLELLSINRAALQMLQLESPKDGTPLSEILEDDLRPISLAVQELTSGRTRAREVALILAGELHYLELSVARLGSGAGWVLALEDSTQLVQAQKLAAWNEAARRIAHEIKNPLTPIQLSAERIARKFRNGDADTGEAIEQGTRTIVGEVGQLKRMVDEFARFARMPAIHLRHAGLAPVLQQAAELFRAVKPGVTITVDADPALELLMDPEQIHRAVGNLLSNAIEATESGEIRIAARRTGHRVTIEVADPGRGVPDADKDKLFLPYFSTKGRGTGLGLAIVHRIVRDHDGQIHVHDNQPRGTRFEIELPA